MWEGERISKKMKKDSNNKLGERKPPWSRDADEKKNKARAVSPMHRDPGGKKKKRF